MINTDQNKFFVDSLEKWNLDYNTRVMPWKGERDPYKIWLSEIILQQTRVEQGLKYYNSFINAFPTIRDLAQASETAVFKLWQGLGYYTRCKNLLATAKFITEKLHGNFPNTYPEILSLKGIGVYTAAAIGSFAFDLPHAVVDGNVFRVLARYFGIDTPIDSTGGKKLFTLLANELLDKKQPATYNQALMDFGAVICKPQLPFCSTCVLKSRCKAFISGKVHLLPVKEKKIIKKERWFYYMVIEYNDAIYLRKRGKGDIWENLFEFVLTEHTEELKEWHTKVLPTLTNTGNIKTVDISSYYRQLLTHQIIQGQFIHVIIKAPISMRGYKLISKNALHELPFPKFISKYLEDKNVSLNLFQGKNDRILWN